MTGRPPLESVTERDIDLLILEELSADASFRKAFLRHLTPAFAGGHTFLGAWHSVTDPSLGESDLLMLIEHEGRRRAYLIENKIDAPPQPKQAVRYRMRGDRGIKESRWDEFTTCIVAPERYLHGIEEADLYDGQLSYERISELLRNASTLDEEHREFRIGMVSQAIEQNRRGYSPKHDERVTAFWRGYWEDVTDAFPELVMPEPKSKPSGSDWIAFCPELLPTGYTLLHKLAAGAVDLQTPYSSESIEELSAACSPMLQEDMAVVATGKSCSVRVAVPQMDRLKDFGSQKQEGRQGMKAAYRLAYLASSIDNAQRAYAAKASSRVDDA